MSLAIIRNQIWGWIRVYPEEWWSLDFLWNWMDFNPPEPTNFYGNNQSAYPQIINPSNNFNCSWFYPGHEVCLWLLCVSNFGDKTETANIQTNWKKGNTIIGTTYNYSISVQPNHRYRYWVGLWIRHWEFDENRSDYKLVRNINWTEHTNNFTVSNIDMNRLQRHGSGSLRVEWDYLCYTDWCNANSSQAIGYKHYIKHDWAVYWNPGVAHKWKIRIDESDHGKIWYVWENGIIRKTHKGDRYWPLGYDDYSELPRNVWNSKAGMIWVENWWHFTYIKFVAKDWYVYRISNWSIYE